MGDDGSKKGLGWFDTETDAPCAYALAGDGALRCLPTGPSVLAVAYTDEACSDPLGLDTGTNTQCARDDEARPRFVRIREDGAECDGDRERFYELGATLGEITSYFRRTGGSCNAVELQPANAAVAYELRGELPPEDFVAFEVEIVGDRLEDARRVGNDGSEGRSHIPYDTVTETPCSIDMASDGVWRCLPTRLDWIYYADADCNDGMVDAMDSVALQCPSRAPFDVFPREQQGRYAHELGEHTTRSCPETASGRIFEVTKQGDALQPDMAFRVYVEGGASVCEPANEGVLSTGYLPLGREVPPEDFLAGSFEQRECGPTVTSGERIVSRAFVMDDGYPHDDDLFDTELGVECFVGLAEDGVQRCLPAARPLTGFYADEACAVDAVDVPVYCDVLQESLGDRGRFAMRDLGLDDDGCALGARVYELIGEELEEAYVRDADGACVPAEVSESRVYKVVGDRLRAEEFVSFAAIDRQD